MTDPDLHELVTCGSDWAAHVPPLNQCEAACEMVPSRAPDAVACTAELAGGGFVGCTEREVVEYKGVRGCCFVSGSGRDYTAYFAVCVRDP